MIVLFHGGDPFASWQNLLNELIRQNKEPRLVHGEEIKSFNDIISGAENFSFFITEGSRATVIKRLSHSKSKTIIKEIADKISGGYKDTIYFYEDEKLDKYSSIVKLAIKHGRVNETKTPSYAGVRNFVTDYLKSQKISIDTPLLESLLIRVGQDKNQIKNELDKLILLVKSYGKSIIEKEHLEVLSQNEIESQVWDLIDSISKKDRKNALKLVNKLYKRDDDFPLILASLANQMELLYLLSSGAANQVMLEKFKIHPFIIEKNRMYAKKFTLEQIKMLFQKLTNLDFNVKQGRIDGRLGLNLLITTL